MSQTPNPTSPVTPATPTTEPPKAQTPPFGPSSSDAEKKAQPEKSAGFGMKS